MRTYAITLLVAVTAACSSISTRHDYDTAFDFSSLGSYAWIDETGVEGEVGLSDLDARRVRAAVNRVLGEKGYVEATADLDFLVAIHGGSRSRVRISPRRYGYGDWYEPRGVEVYEYEEGMLTIDIVDAGKNELVWRGTATKVMSRSSTPEESEETINRAVEKVLAAFPPR